MANLNDSAPSKDRLVKLAVSATFISEPINDYIKWWGNQFGLDIGTEFVPYNQVFRELADEAGLLSTNTGINLLLIRFEDCIRYIQAPCKDKCERLEEIFSQLKELVKRKKKSTPYFAGVFPISTHLSLNQILVNYLEDMNVRWKNFLEELDNVFVVDFTQLKKRYDIREVFDAVTDKEGHLPFTIEFYAAMGTFIYRKIWAYYHQQFKIVVLDCDNTLWKGICGEDGPLGVRVEEPYLELQKFMLQKYREGMMLALCSKNNETDVWEVFEKNPGMLLKKEHFVDWKINWKEKSRNLRELAEELNIGIDSFIFLDDSPGECAEVMSNLPEVLTMQLPDDSNSIPEFLMHVWAFDKIVVTDEDRQRTEMYRADKLRKESQRMLSRHPEEDPLSSKDYLAGLELEVSMNCITPTQISRASQLTQRTNQFNLSTIRRQEDEIRKLIERPDTKCWGIEVKDKFGDYGLVGIVITQERVEFLFVETLILSCRVLGRGVEDAVLVGLKKYCLQRDLSILAADYYPTPKNKPLRDFLQKRWFMNEQKDQYTRYILPCTKISFPLEYIDFYHGSVLKKYPPENPHQEETVALDHIAVAVPDITRAISIFRTLGYACSDIIHDPMQKSNLVMCCKPGFDPIELVEAIDGDSPTKRLSRENGDVPYHLCYRVNDVLLILKKLQDSAVDYEIVSELKPAKLFNRKRVMFIFVKHVGLVELLEDKEETFKLEEKGIPGKNTLKYVVANPGSAFLFYKCMGYVQTGKKIEAHGLEITLEKAGTGKILLIVPKKEGSAEWNFLNKNGPHPYQLCFPEPSPGQRLDCTQQKNANYICYEKVYKKMSSLKCQWEIHLVNEKNLIHKRQFLPLKNHTADILLCLPVYEADESIIHSEKYQSPGDEVESKLADICQDLLKVKKIGVNTSFFAAGGNSLNAVILLSKIQKAFDVLLTLEDIFNKPTIRKLAAVIKGSENIIYSSIRPVENRDHYPLSPAQERIYLLQQMAGESTNYNIHQLISMGIEIDKEKAEDIFKKLIRRHESLRMSFEIVDGLIVQKINEFNQVEFKIQYYDIINTGDWKSKTATSYSCICIPPGFACSPGLSHNPYPSLVVPADCVQPFDLSRAPLFRVALLGYENRKTILMIDIHHIITDGTSQEIILNEFAVLYRGGELPALTLQYKDWVEWQNLEEQERLVNKQQEFWLKEFSGTIPCLNLPADYKRPDIQSFEGDCIHFIIRGEETQLLKSMALKEEVTLFIMLLAILYVLLSKLSGDEDIVIGIPTAGRRHADLQSIAGMFVNTLALRIFPGREKKFKCFLKEVKDKTVGAFDNQEYPFDDLVKEVLQEREANRNPLFDVMFVFYSYLLPPGEFPEARLPTKPELYEYEQNTSQNDLHLAVIDRDEELFFSFTYCTKLFKKETIKLFTKNFQEIVSIVIKNVEIKLEDIHIEHQLLNSRFEVLREDLEEFVF